MKITTISFDMSPILSANKIASYLEEDQEIATIGDWDMVDNRISISFMFDNTTFDDVENFVNEFERLGTSVDFLTICK